MTALATSADVRDRSLNGLSFQAKNAATSYAGGDVAIDANGYLKAAAGAAGEMIVGRQIKEGSVLGNTSATPPTEATVAVDDYILESVPVAGASTIAHLKRIVYCDTDNIKTDLSLTRPTRGQPRGIIVRFKSATSFDVLMFGLKSMLANQSVGTREEISFGSYTNAALINGNIRTGQIMQFHGKVISVHGYVQAAFTGSGGTAAINLEIDTVDVTGGVVTASTAAGGTIGTKLAGTAVTAANEFYEGSVVDVEVASTGGTQTLGQVEVFAVVERLPGT